MGDVVTLVFLVNTQYHSEWFVWIIVAFVVRASVVLNAGCFQKMNFIIFTVICLGCVNHDLAERTGLVRGVGLIKVVVH